MKNVQKMSSQWIYFKKKNSFECQKKTFFYIIFYNYVAAQIVKTLIHPSSKVHFVFVPLKVSICTRLVRVFMC